MQSTNILLDFKLQSHSLPSFVMAKLVVLCKTAFKTRGRFMKKMDTTTISGGVRMRCLRQRPSMHTIYGNASSISCFYAVSAIGAILAACVLETVLLIPQYFKQHCTKLN